MGAFFHAFAEKASRAFGTPVAFCLACLAVVVWALSGPAFGFGDTWQLTINTGTTIVTFLMVFLIQNTQNRQTRATELKLDELLRGLKEARTSMVNVDKLSDEELARLEQEFRRLGQSPEGSQGAGAISDTSTQDSSAEPGPIDELRRGENH